MHSQKTSSPNPLPNPDLTDTSYIQNRMNMPPSILENIQENYNIPPQQFDNDRYVPYDAGNMDPVMYTTRNKDYQDNYREYETGPTPYHPTERAYMSGSEKEYGNTQIVGHMHPLHHNQLMYEKQNMYLGSRVGSPYMSKEQLVTDTTTMYSPRGMDPNYTRNGLRPYSDHPSAHHSVQSLLKNDYQVKDFTESN